MSYNIAQIPTLQKKLLVVYPGNVWDDAALFNGKEVDNVTRVKAQQYISD